MKEEEKKLSLFERPSGHYYKDKQKRLFPSVTTILHSIPNPGLEQWKVCTPGWRKISNAACVFGTETHREIEYYLMGKREKIKHPMQLGAFRKWQQETGFKCTATEIKVKSSAGFAGSLDLFGYMNGQHFIIDLKTSKQLYPEMALQLAAYKYAFLETSKINKIEIGVLRLDKINSEVEWVIYTEDQYKDAIAEFLYLCVQWHKEHNTRKEFNKKFILDE